MFRIGDFTLKTGIKSPFYIDLRLLPSYPKLFKMTIDLMKRYVQDNQINPDGLGGIMSAGIPFCTGLALKMNLPMLQIRKKSKKYGLKNLIEGKLEEPNMEVLVIDDLISTGASKIPAIEALASKNYTVKDILVIIDRRKSDYSAKLQNEFNIHSLLTIRELLEILSQHENLNKEELSMLNNATTKWNKSI